MRASQVTEVGYYWQFSKRLDSPTVVFYQDGWWSLMGTDTPFETHEIDGELIGPITYERVAELERQVAGLETLRPVWAQGHTDESIAAQVQAAALGQIWGVLNVTDQTACMDRLRRLLLIELAVESKARETDARARAAAKNAGEPE